MPARFTSGADVPKDEDPNDPDTGGWNTQTATQTTTTDSTKNTSDSGDIQQYQDDKTITSPPGNTQEPDEKNKSDSGDIQQYQSSGSTSLDTTTQGTSTVKDTDPNDPETNTTDDNITLNTDTQTLSVTGTGAATGPEDYDSPVIKDKGSNSSDITTVENDTTTENPDDTTTQNPDPDPTSEDNQGSSPGGGAGSDRASIRVKLLEQGKIRPFGGAEYEGGNGDGPTGITGVTVFAAVAALTLAAFSALSNKGGS